MEYPTLVKQIASERVEFDSLHENYHPMLELVRQLIGVVPNCDPYLEIWPTGFRTYNLIVPNALNLPFSLWGMGAPKAQVGLGMYISSRAAGCPYCTAHTCSFALRRGTTAEAIVGDRDPKDAAVVAVAEALSVVPAELTVDQLIELQRHFSANDVEGILLGIAMMGFLNKFMDAMGVELEDEALSDVGGLLKPTGWSAGKHVAPDYELPDGLNLPDSDNWRTYLKVLRQAPGAIRIESQWTKGVPDRWPQAGEYLKSKTGHNFPVLSRLTQKRFIKALTTVLRDNLDPSTTKIGLKTKALSGLIFSAVVGNETLAEEARILAMQYADDLSDEHLDLIYEFGLQPTEEAPSRNLEILEEMGSLPFLSKGDAAALILARAASPSPAYVNPAILEHISPLVDSAGVVELVVWLSVQQLMHRLDRFYAVMDLSFAG